MTWLPAAVALIDVGGLAAFLICLITADMLDRDSDITHRPLLAARDRYVDEHSCDEVYWGLYSMSDVDLDVRMANLQAWHDDWSAWRPSAAVVAHIGRPPMLERGVAA